MLVDRLAVLVGCSANVGAFVFFRADGVVLRVHLRLRLLANRISARGVVGRCFCDGLGRHELAQ